MKPPLGYPIFLIVPALALIFFVCADSRGQEGDHLNAGKSEQQKPKVPKDIKFEPLWREKGDCGPSSLYVLMRLNDRKTSLADVKEVVPFDEEKGCSLADLERGAAKLGFPTEIRFVNPEDLPKLPRPFILHGWGSLERGTGHFFVIVDYSPEKEQYYLIDTAYESSYNLPEQSVLKLFSGYVLLPRNATAVTFRNLLGLSLFLLGLVGLALILYRYPIGKRKTVPGKSTLMCQLETQRK
jgi:hypothetical protein